MISKRSFLYAAGIVLACLNMVIAIPPSLAADMSASKMHIAVLPREFHDLKILYSSEDDLRVMYKNQFSRESRLQHLTIFGPKTEVFHLALFASLCGGMSFKGCLAVWLPYIAAVETVPYYVMRALLEEPEIYSKIVNRGHRTCENAGYKGFSQNQGLMAVRFVPQNFLERQVYMNGFPVTLQKAIDLDLLNRRVPAFIFSDPITCWSRPFLRREWHVLDQKTTEENKNTQPKE